MDRRGFLGGAAALGGTALAAPLLGWPDLRRNAYAAAGSLLDGQAADCPVTHIVALMMENRSFDHWLGWVADDEAWLEQGRSLYGASFGVDGEVDARYPAPDGNQICTYHLPSHAGEVNPYRGCGHPDPGHGWDAGRTQRDAGFMAEGTGNDAFALGWYKGADLPFTDALARRFTLMDRYHCSVLGPTFPNREYFHAAQSGGNKTNALPIDSLGFPWATIWDRLMAANVPCGYYFNDLPATGLWGPRLVPITHHIERFFADCALGTLPNVTFVDPIFTTGYRADDHPHGDVRAGQNYCRDIFKAFAESPLWENGLFVLTYDEWGGFFDHVPPPVLADDRASADDAENFGQAGFRVPTIVASPYARPGFVDHDLYDHTSVLRFIEWRFLGAPAEGPEGEGWWLTARDRNAANLGRALTADGPDPEIGFPLDLALPLVSLACEGDTLSGIPGVPSLPLPVAAADADDTFASALATGYFEAAGYRTDTPVPTELRYLDRAIAPSATPAAQAADGLPYAADQVCAASAGAPVIDAAAPDGSAAAGDSRGASALPATGGRPRIELGVLAAAAALAARRLTGASGDDAA